MVSQPVRDDMEKTRVLKKTKIFYGYWILVAGFFCLFIESGFVYYAFSLFVRSLQVDFGWGRGEIMLGLTVYLVVGGVSSPFAGRLVDRYGVRKVISISAFTAGLGFILLTQIHNLWLFYSSYVIIGLGMTGISHVPVSAAISNWFKKRRGTALGIAAIGIGVGGFVVAPVVGGYLIPNLGWRASYFVLGLVTWAIPIPLALLVMKTKPADMGLYPDGAETAEREVIETKAVPSVSERLSLGKVLATSVFWLIGVSYFLGMVSQSGVVQNQVPYLEDTGYLVAMAAGALGAVGLGSAIGKLSFGWLCDHIQPKYAWCIGLVFQAVATIIILFIGPASPLALIWLYALIMGLGIGSWLPTLSMLSSTNFGLASYGVIFGIMNAIQRIGTAIGPITAGYMYDAMNTYRWAFIIFLALYLIAIPTILVVRRSKFS